MSAVTVNDIFFAAVDKGNPELVLHRDDGGKWVPISSLEFYRRTVGMAQALRRWGVKKGDRVGLLSENRPEWAIADFATLLLGAADVPLYPTLTAEQTGYILADSGARILFVSNAEQLKKVLSIKDRTALERIILMDQPEDDVAVSMADFTAAGPATRDPELEAAARAVAPSDLATVIYTSGTTGTPKGVMLTHQNIVSNVEHSVSQFGWSLGNRYLSFLPLSHITARHLDYTLFERGITIAYCSHIEMLSAMLLEVRPSIFVSVPRIYEKFRTEAQRRASAGLKKAAFDWAIGVGRKHKAEVIAGRRPKELSWRIANRLLFSRIQDAFGGRVETFISGGAPLSLDLAEWYAACGMRIFEGYGLTETSPVIAVNTPTAIRLGTVGKPLSNLEVRIAGDGELLVRGDSVFKSYWNLPQETANAFEDGWFKTGDIGSLDAEGFLSITDRKKDLIKTSGGKFIAPQPIENALKSNVLVAHAVVIGDKRKFASVLIVPHFPTLEDWAGANDVKFATRQELVAHPKVRALYDGIVADLNKRLARFETLKYVSLISEDFSIAGGELTPKLSVRRREVEKKYAQEIEAIYSRERSSPSEAATVS